MGKQIINTRAEKQGRIPYNKTAKSPLESDKNKDRGL